MSAVLVTGATGNVGDEVVRALLAQGTRVVAADRQPGRVRERFGASVDAVPLDFREPAGWDAALRGVEQLFLLRPPAISDVRPTLNAFVDRARSRGVGHVVFLSVAGVEKNRFVPHRAVEEHLRSLGPEHTNLRPGFFAQNLATAYARDIVEDSRIYVPAGHAPVNWIDARDIAAVVARIVREPSAHRGQSYTLTGPGAVPWSEVVDALSAALGRRVRYEPASVLGYVRHLARRGLPRGAIAVQTTLHVLLRFGQGAAFDPTLERLLGRPGRTVRAYIEENAARWAR